MKDMQLMRVKGYHLVRNVCSILTLMG